MNSAHQASNENGKKISRISVWSFYFGVISALSVPADFFLFWVIASFNLLWGLYSVWIAIILGLLSSLFALALSVAGLIACFRFGIRGSFYALLGFALGVGSIPLLFYLSLLYM